MYLGEIIVPRNDPDWVPKISYRPEPPLSVRGSLDPWNMERTRALWLAEEEAWKKILPLQAQYNDLKRREAVAIGKIQHWMRDLERLTGKKSGMADASNYAILVYSLAGGPYAWAAALAKLGVDMILSIGKKKQAKSIMKKLEDLGREMESLQRALAETVSAIEPLIATRDRVAAEQQVRIAEDLQRNQALVAQRRVADKAAGQSHAERARFYERLYPSRQGAHHAL